MSEKRSRMEIDDSIWYPHSSEANKKRSLWRTRRPRSYYLQWIVWDIVRWFCTHTWQRKCLYNKTCENYIRNPKNSKSNSQNYEKPRKLAHTQKPTRQKRTLDLREWERNMLYEYRWEYRIRAKWKKWALRKTSSRTEEILNSDFYRHPSNEQGTRMKILFLIPSWW